MTRVFLAAMATTCLLVSAGWAQTADPIKKSFASVLQKAA